MNLNNLFKNLIINPPKKPAIKAPKYPELISTSSEFIRDEKVVKGENYKNGILQIKAEGEKVAKGEAIFRYYSNKEDNLTKKIENAELYIYEIEKHKKSIFEFWKFTNKDEISTLTQGEQEELPKTKIEK